MGQRPEQVVCGGSNFILYYFSGLVLLEEMISIYDETPTGFTINWTAVASSSEQLISIDDGSTHYNDRKLTSSNSFKAKDLPSGTTFNVTIYFINKHRDEANMTARASTCKCCNSVRKLLYTV